MKSKVIVSILAVVALGLLVFLFLSRKTISEQTSHISILSNQVVETHTKLDDLTQVHQTTIADLDKRNALGWATYKREMLPENDVDWLQNLYEELLDSCMYVKGELLKRAKQEL